MVLRCAWGTCNADERYPERLEGGRFIRFPTPKKNLKKCERWIKACGRPHEQLNVSRINQHKAVCSKHFVGGNGPTVEFQDPIPAVSIGCTINSTGSKPYRKRLINSTSESSAEFKVPSKKALLKDVTIRPSDDNGISRCSDGETGISTQTEEPCVSALDMLTLTAEVVNLKHIVQAQQQTINKLQQDLSVKDEEIEFLKLEINKNMIVVEMEN